MTCRSRRFVAAVALLVAALLGTVVTSGAAVARCEGCAYND
ncbi:hypothetical protein ACQEVF_57455 [Nonomuraea polychroma]